MSLLRFLILAVGLGGCAGPVCVAGSGQPVEVFTLFMGRGDLTEADWRSFLEDTVSVYLPGGYTVFDADGGWMNPRTHRTVREGTKVLVVALPDVPGSLVAVNAVRTAYQRRFRQILVGMTVERGCGDF